MTTDTPPHTEASTDSPPDSWADFPPEVAAEFFLSNPDDPDLENQSWWLSASSANLLRIVRRSPLHWKGVCVLAQKAFLTQKKLEAWLDAMHNVAPSEDPPAPPDPSLSSTNTQRLTRQETPYGDVWSAEQFLAHFGQDFLWCEALGGWRWWSGTHWKLAEHGEAYEFARQALRLEGQYALGREDGKLLAFLARQFSHGKLTALLAQAATMPQVQCRAADFDTNPWLLNCANGLLDLQTATLLPHHRRHRISRCLDIPYLVEAPCPVWAQFLWTIMGGSQPTDFNPDADDRAQRLIDFLQRAVGYALTGCTMEDCLFLLYGSGRNGKSKFVDACHQLLGSYARSAQMQSFLHQEKETTRNDLADLQGVRFVSAIETGQSKRFAEGMIKQLTGGDRVKARFLFHEYFEFLPNFKLFLAFNEKPSIRGSDVAIWERIKLIPFSVFVPAHARDKHLAEKFRQELPGILAWAVRGCLAWQRDGLQEPEEVVAATGAYRKEMDVFGQFLEACCVTGPAYTCTTAALWRAYQEWCKREGSEATNSTAFGKEMTRRGFVLSDSRKTRGGIGIIET